MIADSRGIHYDADGESDLLHALDSGEPTGWMQRGEIGDPAQLMARFREIGASKYNWFAGEFRDERLPEEPGILVVDQTRGDASIRYGGLSVSVFETMLRSALDECHGRAGLCQGASGSCVSQETLLLFRSTCCRTRG